MRVKLLTTKTNKDMREFKILREEMSQRGGGIEIDLSPFGFKGHKMSAYQNYLGGGMLGRIVTNDTIRSQVTNVRLQLEFSNRFDELDEIGDELMRLFYSKMNPHSDEYNDDFEELQQRSVTGY